MLTRRSSVVADLLYMLNLMARSSEWKRPRISSASLLSTCVRETAHHGFRPTPDQGFQPPITKSKVRSRLPFVAGAPCWLYNVQSAYFTLPPLSTRMAICFRILSPPGSGRTSTLLGSGASYPLSLTCWISLVCEVATRSSIETWLPSSSIRLDICACRTYANRSLFF